MPGNKEGVMNLFLDHLTPLPAVFIRLIQAEKNEKKKERRPNWMFGLIIFYRL